MAFTQVQKLQLNHQVDRILHVPGNFQGGNLEMTMVFDYDAETDWFKEKAGQIITALKAHSPVFRNVRFHAVKWKGDFSITNHTIPMTFVQTGRFFEEDGMDIPLDAGITEEKKGINNIKNLEVLLENLKLFHARSKLIFVLTQGQYQISDKEVAKKALNPFLKQKMLLLGPDYMKTGMEIFMELI